MVKEPLEEEYIERIIQHYRDVREQFINQHAEIYMKVKTTERIIRALESLVITTEQKAAPVPQPTARTPRAKTGATARGIIDAVNNGCRTVKEIKEYLSEKHNLQTTMGSVATKLSNMRNKGEITNYKRYGWFPKNYHPSVPLVVNESALYREIIPLLKTGAFQSRTIAYLDILSKKTIGSKLRDQELN